VPQGSIIPHAGFNIGATVPCVFYNDMADQLVNARVLKYTDDTIIYFPGQEIGAIERALAHNLKLWGSTLMKTSL
jgi:hypothetical protein